MAMARSDSPWDWAPETAGSITAAATKAPIELRGPDMSPSSVVAHQPTIQSTGYPKSCTRGPAMGQHTKWLPTDVAGCSTDYLCSTLRHRDIEVNRRATAMAAHDPHPIQFR